MNHSDGRSFVLAPSNKDLVTDGNYSFVNQANLFNKQVRTTDFVINEKLTNEIKYKIETSETALNWGMLLEAELALETDTDFFKACGSDIKKAQAYAISLINMVSLLYIREVNIAIKLTWLKTWTDSPADPYQVNGDAYALPPKVLEYWRNNYKSVPRDLAHVTTSIGYGGGGFGYLNGLCGAAGDYSFAVSSVQGNHTYPTINFTYDVYIMAHEMGHNFNASHTHSCDFGYPLDTCMVADAYAGKCLDTTIKARPNPGSIMSYCGSANYNAGLGYWVRMIFLEESKQQIRKAAENAPCIMEPAKPVLILNYPMGNEVFKSNDTTTIKWSASGISSINLYYSDDSGESWNEIAKSVNASLNGYLWNIPDICSEQVLIRISDVIADSIMDVNKFAFSVKFDDPTGLVAYYPFSGNTRDMQSCHLNNMRQNGIVNFTEDRSGNPNAATGFDGKSYLYTPKFPFAFDELTFSFWFNAEDMNEKRTIIGSNYAEGWVAETFLWGQFGAAYYVDGQGIPKQVWGGYPEMKKWNHGAFTWDGTTAILYLNGKVVGQESDGKHTLNKFSPTPLYIGSRKDVEFYKGLIDDVYVYKRALSATEIVNLYNQKPTVVENTTQGNSEFDIYPNPAKDEIYLDLKALSGTKPEIIISDYLGRIVKRFSLETISSDGYLFPVNISELKSGIYIIRLVTGRYCSIRKLIITE